MCSLPVNEPPFEKYLLINLKRRHKNYRAAFFIPCVKANLKSIKMKKATWYNSKYCDVKNINIKKRLAVKDKPFQYSYLINC